MVDEGQITGDHGPTGPFTVVFQDVAPASDELRKAAKSILTGIRVALDDVGLQPAHQASAPVTHAQWITVLEDSRIWETAEQLAGAAWSLAAPGKPTGKSLGRVLPSLARDVRDLGINLTTLVGHVTRYVPPAPMTTSVELIERFGESVRAFVRDALASASNGWDATTWRKALEHAGDADSLLLNAFSMANIDVGDDDPWLHCLKITKPAGKVFHGTEYAAWLATVWRTDSEQLDARLRNQLRELVGDDLVFDGMLRRHLAHLATDGRPFTAYRGAVHARDITVAALDADPDRRSVITEHQRDDERALMTHYGVNQAFESLRSATTDEQRVRAYSDAYKIIAEGDLRRAVETLLRLRGVGVDELPPGSSLGPIRQLCSKLPTELAQRIGELINLLVRNKTVHEYFSWNQRRKTAVYGDTDIDLNDVIDLLDRAMSLSGGIEAGITVACAIRPEDNLNRNVLSSVGAAFSIIQACALAELAVSRATQVGDAMVVETTGIRITDVRRVFTAIVMATPYDADTERWIFRQPGDIADLVVNSNAARKADQFLADERTRIGEFMPAVDLILYADAALNAGVRPAAIADSIAEIGFRHIVGECDRLRPALTLGQQAAASQITEITEKIAEAMRIAAEGIPDSAAVGRLEGVALFLTKRHRLFGGGPTAILTDVERVRRALGKMRPAVIPWAT